MNFRGHVSDPYDTEDEDARVDHRLHNDDTGGYPGPDFERVFTPDWDDFCAGDLWDAYTAAQHHDPTSTYDYDAHFRRAMKALITLDLETDL